MNRSWKTNRPGGLALTRWALDACGFGPKDLILDAGCGFGATVNFLNGSCGLKALGLELDWSRLAAARKEHKGLPPVRARLPRLPFRSGVFQGIFCECVLSLVPDKPACLEGFFRILSPGGFLILADLVVPNLVMSGSPSGPEGFQDRLAGDGQKGPATCLDGALTQSGLRSAVEGAGFRILRMEDHTRLLREMACQMVFDHGSLDRFWQELTGTDMSTGLAGLCRAGNLKPEYALVIAEKHG